MAHERPNPVLSCGTTDPEAARRARRRELHLKTVDLLESAIKCERAADELERVAEQAEKAGEPEKAREARRAAKRCVEEANEKRAKAREIQDELRKTRQ